MNEKQEQQGKQPGSPGELLCAARERRGYQQSVIAERLRLSLQTIIDIENNDFSHFAAEIYLRGYIRSYSGLVDLDPEAVLKAYDSMGVVIERDPQMPVMMAQDVPMSRRMRQTKRKTLWWAGFSVLFVLIVMVVLWWREQQHPVVVSAIPVSAATAATTKKTTKISKKHLSAHQSKFMPNDSIMSVTSVKK